MIATDKLIANYSRVLRAEDAGRIAPEPWNYGYWNAETTNHLQASENLLSTLVSRLGNVSGRVLDVAFGKGESTRKLCEMFGIPNVVGINIALDQVEYARARGLGCELHVMDAADLQFPADSFEAMLCIEAAFHFRSREQFLREAFRTLRPGGRLVMSDVLFRTAYGLDAELFPAENLTASIDEYTQVFVRAGFAPGDVEIQKSTHQQLLPLARRLAEATGILPGLRDDSARLNPEQAPWYTWFIVTRLLNIEDCVIVCASKQIMEEESRCR